ADIETAALAPRASGLSLASATVLRRCVLACALVSLAVLAGCGGSGDSVSLGKQATTVPPTDPPTASTLGVVPPRPGFTLVATAAKALTALNIWGAPGDTQPKLSVPNPWVVNPAFPDQTVPQTFLVLEQRNDGWVRVMLPIRPNGSDGWIRLNDVVLGENPYRVKVDLSRRRITVTNLNDVVYDGPVAIGAPATPTP